MAATGSARRPGGTFVIPVLLVLLIAGCATKDTWEPREWEPDHDGLQDSINASRIDSRIYHESTGFFFDAPESAVKVSMQPRQDGVYLVNFSYLELKSSAWFVILDETNATVLQDGPFSGSGSTRPVVETSGNATFRLWAISGALGVHIRGPDPQLEDIPVYYRTETLKFDLMEPVPIAVEEADVGLRILDAPPGLWNLVAPNGTVTAMLGTGFDEVAWLAEPGEWSMEPILPALGDVRIRISSL